MLQKNSEFHKVGILGGTFDPIHLGHLIIGEAAYDQCGLEKVLVMPSGRPPHKDNNHISQEVHRERITRLAIASNPHFAYSDFELVRKGTIYTVDTLRLLREENPGTWYYFILGEDSLLQIESWREPAEIFKLCTIAVAHRDDEDDSTLDAKISQLRDAYNADIVKLRIPLISISSTDIRTRVKNGQTIRYFVCGDVEQYIYQNRLYKEDFTSAKE